MPNFTGNKGDVVARGIRTLTQTTPIRQTAVGGKARAILETSGEEVQNLARVQDKNLRKAFLSSTYGQFLDHFGAMVGLTRYEQRNAEVLSTDQVIRFYTRFGNTFGEINGGSAIVIPAGTVITAPAQVATSASTIYSGVDSANTVFDRSIHYSMTESLICGKDDTEAFASARALTAGLTGNLAAPKMLKQHSFTGYSEGVQKSLLVTNDKPILNGFDEESEGSFKYRISKEITACEKANEVAIRTAALSVPGVVDVVIIPFGDGAGRFNVYVKSITSFVSDKMITDVQAAIDNSGAVGCIGYARKPYQIGIEIDSNLRYSTGITQSQKEFARENLAFAAIEYLNSLDIGTSLSLVTLANEIKKLTANVIAVGSASETLFDAVFVWYPARLADGGRRREKLRVQNLSVPAHSRIVVETSITDPIRFI